MSTAQGAVLAHLRGFFAGRRVNVREPRDARVRGRIPGFRIAAIAPGPVIGKPVYVSMGCWDTVHDSGHGLEFVLVAPAAAAARPVGEIAAHYHANPDDPGFRLDLGHTVPIQGPCQWRDR